MRIVIAEDNALLAQGLTALLEALGNEVLATTEDAESFVTAAITHRPDVAVVDVRLPPSFTDEGIRAALRAREHVPGLPILVLSQYVEDTYARELLADGTGVGYLLKDRVARVDDFVEALHRVAAGGTVLDPDVVRQLLATRGNPLSRLTEREREVLAMMAQGYGNSEIAARLVVTERAVHKHVGNIFVKFDLPPEDSGDRRVLAVLTHLGAPQRRSRRPGPEAD
ncbi:MULTISPECIES: response regulator transcription factor [Kitasatospora]|uniref:response regulator transcription factor n=1 Tax=Kitasatospora TaxID=2063 RepID=UPI000C7088EF|nr:response regulator transcription factor [Kitasatospora sp. GP30]MDH6141506.1 DNA-binding NarL/FixJ family response regulator [Kitasatospora sp. GP30]